MFNCGQVQRKRNYLDQPKKTLDSSSIIFKILALDAIHVCNVKRDRYKLTIALENNSTTQTLTILIFHSPLRRTFVYCTEHESQSQHNRNTNHRFLEILLRRVSLSGRAVMRLRSHHPFLAQYGPPILAAPYVLLEKPEIVFPFD